MSRHRGTGNGRRTGRRISECGGSVASPAASLLDDIVDERLPVALSHHSLLVAVPAVGTGDRVVDLLVVPTSRPEPDERPGIEAALELARSGRVARLAVLVSKDAARPDAIDRLRQRLSEGLPAGVPALIEVVDGGRQRLPTFDADRVDITSAWRRYGRGARQCLSKANEVGSKRNLGLLLARRLGARFVLFLDDYVSPDGGLGRPDDDPARIPDQTLDAHSLSAGIEALERGEVDVVGWLLRGYDDNSVVCRARSVVGDAQTQFIGGGALLVDADRCLPYFPAIYNEDWLFLLGLGFGLLRRHRMPRFGCAGFVRQAEYDGFVPRRARAEELGEILGEGFFALLQVGRHPLEVTDRATWRRYWKRVFRQRRDLVFDVLIRLGDIEVSDEDHDELAVRAYLALEGALTVHAHLEARLNAWVDEFVRYREAWSQDLETWNGCLSGPHPETTDDLLLAPVLIGVDAPRAFGLVPPATDDARPAVAVAEGEAAQVCGVGDVEVDGVVEPVPVRPLIPAQRRGPRRAIAAAAARSLPVGRDAGTAMVGRLVLTVSTVSALGFALGALALNERLLHF